MMSLSFEEEFRQAVALGDDRLLVGVALAATGSDVKGTTSIAFGLQAPSSPICGPSGP